MTSHLRSSKQGRCGCVTGSKSSIPYGEDGSILQLEKVNFPPDKRGDLKALDPPYCVAVSAKRYVLFNKVGGMVVVRKASGHGLGHLLAPYDESPEKRAERIERIGVPLWQEDLWKQIIRAAEGDQPDLVPYMDMTGFDAPAASPLRGDDARAARLVQELQRSAAARASCFPIRLFALASGEVADRNGEGRPRRLEKRPLATPRAAAGRAIFQASGRR